MKQYSLTLLCLFILGLARVSAQTAPAPNDAALTEVRALNTKVAELFRAGKVDEAQPLAQKALALSEKSFGEEDPRVSTAAYNLAEIWFAQKQFGKAQSAFRKAVGLYEKQFGQDSPRLANALDRLALAAYANGDANATENAAQRALSIREKAFGAESKEVAPSLDQLAQLYELQGNYERATPLYQRLLAIKKITLGAESPDTFEVALRYACVLRKYDKPQEAEAIAQSFPYKPRNGDPPDISGGVLNGKALFMPPPIWTAKAKAAGADGTVSIQVTFNQQGEVIRACAIAGHPLLRQYAENAARGARFPPMLVNGKPVIVTGIVNYNFVSRYSVVPR